MKEPIKITLLGEEYYFIKDYRDNETLRTSFNELARNIHGIDFEPWYQQGYWGECYRPYSILHQHRIVANISVNTIDFLIDNERKHAVQLGTVMTEKEYRNRGLIRKLMDIIRKEYENSCDTMYLYANDTVLDFYPKFGFKKADEYIYTKRFIKKEQGIAFRKLNIKIPADKEILTRLVTNTLPFSRIAMCNNPGLDMFYLTSFMSDDIYYSKELNLAAVAEVSGEQFILNDVFCEKVFDLDTVIYSLLPKPEMKVILGFTPVDVSAYECELWKEEGSTYFVNGRNLAEYGKFPTLSHA